MQTSTAPTIEIAGHRDEQTHEFRLTVLVDGKRHDTVRWQIVDPAAITGPVSMAAWRAMAWMATRETSTGYARKITEFYGKAEKNVELHDDRQAAENAQLDATLIAELAPSTWFRAAAGSANPNNLNAARAVVAVRVFGTCPASSRNEALKTVMAAYRDAAGSRNESLATSLRDLFTDLRHLADAWRIQVEGEQDPDNEFGQAIAGLMGALEEAAVSMWADDLAVPGLLCSPHLAEYALNNLKITAYNRYHDNVVRGA
ncbi:hypothetical protein JNUCC0626_32175 [Lentzea sp. JNUCC 0626]|uniref:hypothetical protein n=1 Tax=Lentzea sp. JNUCC 0626 TaxID=3367513 RepID=UPI003747F4E0